MEKIYILDWDTNHLVDVENDAFIVPYETSKRLGGYVLRSSEFEHP